MELSVHVETANLTWPRWKRFVPEVEKLGYRGLYLCDHFTTLPGDPDLESIDAWIALTYLADHSERLRLGPVVSPVSFRDPIILARQARDLDDLSGGRFVLGIGAGWVEREHEMFGWPLGNVRGRMDRFAESLEVITRLLRSSEPTSFEGKYYTLRNAELFPRPSRPGGPDILIGTNTGGNRSIALTARYADAFNITFQSLERAAETLSKLDARLDALGRPRSSVKRTMMSVFGIGRDEAEIERAFGWLLQHANPQRLSLREYASSFNALGHFVGTPEDTIPRLRAYAEAGVEEVMVDIFDVGDVGIEMLRLIADEVMPRI
jgi:alkanesulfonate monooxygenase SsuD/methylene tetrahydromethanopterin reductase-like flavin-dependent oxidoreductase (luciferase family)